MNFLALLKKPSAYIPLVMSLTALMLVVLAIIFGATSKPDEDAAAHVFQLLMAAQVPMIYSLSFAGWAAALN